MNSISKYERRDVITEMNRRSDINNTVRIVGVVVILVCLALLAYHAFIPVLAVGPAEAPEVSWDGQKGTMTELCARYRNDELSQGLKMERETAELCGFNK